MPSAAMRIAGNLQLGHLLDFDDAHAAISRNRKLRVIAIVRDRDADIGRRLNDRLAFLGGDTSLPSMMIYYGSIE